MLALLEEEMSVGGLERETGIKQPNLSLELRKLRDSEMVVTRRESKVIFYSIASREIRSTILDLAQLAGIPTTRSDYKDQQSAEPDAPAGVFQLGSARQGECAHFPAVLPRRSGLTDRS